MTSAQGGSGFTVGTAGLRTHAGVLNQVSGALGQAVDAARQVTLADAAYGQLPVSAQFAALVRMVATPGVDALAQAQTTVSSYDTAINQTAANYDVVEQGNTASFTTVDGVA